MYNVELDEMSLQTHEQTHSVNLYKAHTYSHRSYSNEMCHSSRKRTKADLLSNEHFYICINV